MKRLRVDCTEGAGTINACRPSAGGTLALENIPESVTQFDRYEVPITVAGVQNAAALGSWKVVVDGVPRSYRLRIMDGKLTLIDGNTVIFVR